MGTDILIERVELLEDTLNEDARTIDVVLIRPGWSKNGRYYSRKVLASAAPLYANAFAFDGHQSLDDIKKGVGRKISEATGRYMNVHIGPDGELRATRHVYPNDAGNAVWPVIMDAVKNPGEVRAGLSHTAVGTTAKGEAEGRKGEIVEDITAVNSVDDVVSPAAGGEYTALVADTNTLKTAIIESLSYDEWETSRPDYVEALKKQNQRARQTEQEREARSQLEEALATIATLKAQLTERETQLKRAQSDAAQARDEASRAAHTIALEKALQRASLSPKAEAKVRERIADAPPDDWQRIVQEAKELHDALGGQRPEVTGAPQRVHQLPATERHTAPVVTTEDMQHVASADDLIKLLKQKEAI